MPGTYNMKLYRGDSAEWTFTLWEDEAQTVASDLTGAEVAAEIRNKSAGDKIVALECEFTGNVVTVRMTPDLYTDCPARGVWDLQITFPDGTVRTVLAGKVNCTGDVTDSEAMA